MTQPWDRESPKRLKKGQKRTKKKEAVAGIIYTVSRADLASETSQVPVVNKEDKLVGLLSVRALLDQFFGLNSQNC